MERGKIYFWSRPTRIIVLRVTSVTKTINCVSDELKKRFKFTQEEWDKYPIFTTPKIWEPEMME